MDLPEHYLHFAQVPSSARKEADLLVFQSQGGRMAASYEVNPAQGA
jgi:hypothetical protein